MSAKLQLNVLSTTDSNEQLTTWARNKHAQEQIMRGDAAIFFTREYSIGKIIEQIFGDSMMNLDFEEFKKTTEGYGQIYVVPSTDDALSAVKTALAESPNARVHLYFDSEVKLNHIALTRIPAWRVSEPFESSVLNEACGLVASVTVLQRYRSNVL